MSRLQERLRLGNRQNEGQLPGPAHARQIACGISGAEFLGDQELVQAARHRDPAGHGRSGVAPLIEGRDVVPDLLQADFVQAEAVLIQPDEVAVEVVGVGLDGACCGTQFRRQSVEPELSQPLVGAHEFLLKEDPAMAPVTNFLSKCLFTKILRVPALTPGVLDRCSYHLGHRES